MAFYLSPLVDVNEIDLSTTIPAVATSIGVIALRETYKGAEKKQTFVTDEADLTSAFGEPDSQSFMDIMAASGFLKYGNKLYATRVANEDAEFASMTVGTGVGAGLTLDITATAIVDSVGGIVTSVILNAGGTGYVVGEYVTVDGNGVGEQDCLVKVTSDTGGTGVVDGVELVAGGEGYTTGVGAVTTSTIVGDQLTVGDDGAGTDIEDPALADGVLDFTILPSEDPDDFGDDVQVTTLTDFFWFIASSRGLWGDNVRIAFMDYATQQSMLNGTLNPTYYGEAYSAFAEIDSQLESTTDFLILVQEKPQRKATWVTKETFNVSTSTEALDDGGGKRYVEDVVNQQSSFIRVSADVSSINGQDFPTALSQDTFYTFLAGSDGTGVPSDASIIEAYRLYEDPETVDVNILIDSAKSETVKSDLIAICEERLDCMTVLDVPQNLVVNNKGNETTDLRDWRNITFNENTSYASVYGNWIEVYDKYNQKYRWIPASGHISGIYAKTDDVADPWWAPAGLNRAVLTGVRRLAWNPKLGNRDILYSNGINPIVSFAGQGKVVWGQKTMLAKESAFNRVNVRRLFITLEKAISTAAKYFLFEPNDTVTRNLLVNMINPFLRDVQSRRGIFDFKVICDTSNNTPERVDRNELWCDILIKPTRTAEFIVLNFVATKTGASFEEAAAAV